MCIRKEICAELGDDPRQWSKQSPLPPPDWFDGEVTKFADAVRSAATEDLKQAREQLALVRSDELREWFGEHAQNAGLYRCRHLAGRRKNLPVLSLDPLRNTQRHEPFVYNRDGYRCRYCACRVVPGVVLKVFSRVIGRETFGVSGPRPQRHGAAVAFKACADHVLPHFIGGRTDPANLVTACWGCNFGKNFYTVEEIGIENPLLREPYVTNDWDGLMSLIPRLQRILSDRSNESPVRRPLMTLKHTSHEQRRHKKESNSTEAEGKVGIPIGVGGVSIPLLRKWLTEWEVNGGKAPASWKRTRGSFLRRNLETIKAQTKDFAS